MSTSAPDLQADFQRPEIARLRHALARRIDPELGAIDTLPFMGDWVIPTADEAAVLLSRLTLLLARRGVDQPWPLAHEALFVRLTGLPCYGARSAYGDVVLRHRNGRIGHAGFILRGEELVPLRPASAPIHDFNESCPPLFDDAAATGPYVRMFCWTICADYGPFQMLEKAALTKLKFKGGARGLKPATIKPAKEDGNWEVRTHMLYGENLFVSSLTVREDGMVIMEDDDPSFELAKDSPRYRNDWLVDGYVKYRPRFTTNRDDPNG